MQAITIRDRAAGAAGLTLSDIAHPHAAENDVIMRVHAAGFTRSELDWPAPTSDPGPGAEVKMSYDHPLSPSSRVYAVVAGFITTYLTSTTGLDRYVVADSWIKPIGGYQSAVIQSADTTSEVTDIPDPDAQIHVRATVVAQTSQFATITFTFPLTVENSGGTWMIADIDFIPQFNVGADSVPAGSHD